jgi:hypothetical protein
MPSINSFWNKFAAVWNKGMDIWGPGESLCVFEHVGHWVASMPPISFVMDGALLAILHLLIFPLMFITLSWCRLNSLTAGTCLSSDNSDRDEYMNVWWPTNFSLGR